MYSPKIQKKAFQFYRWVFSLLLLVLLANLLAPTITVWTAASYGLIGMLTLALWTRRLPEAGVSIAVVGVQVLGIIDAIALAAYGSAALMLGFAGFMIYCTWRDWGNGSEHDADLALAEDDAP